MVVSPGEASPVPLLLELRGLAPCVGDVGLRRPLTPRVDCPRWQTVQPAQPPVAGEAVRSVCVHVNVCVYAHLYACVYPYVGVYEV